jgi:hypothetical protein
MSAPFSKNPAKARLLTLQRGVDLAFTRSIRISVLTSQVTMSSQSHVSNALHTHPAIVARPPAHGVIPVPARLGIPHSDWETFLTTRANTVVVGNEDAALGLWTAVWPTLQKPIYWVDADRLSLPRQSTGTLMLQGAHTLSESAQQQLFEWLEHDAQATRVLTTAAQPLFPLVESGRFLDALYYRLNMLLLTL